MNPFRQMFAGLLRLHFLSFVAKCIETVDPAATYVENWHILVLAAKLELVQRGVIRRLMINLPPRSLKTHIVSVAFCAWLLGHDPTKRIICVTYSNDVAKTQAKLFNKIMRCDWFQAAFPECRPERTNKLMDWYTTSGGNRLATSIQGSILSRGADIIILDDPNKGQEIHSKVSREKVKAVYDQVISTRLNEPKKGAIVCVMQRLHPDDLAGHLLGLEPWDEVVMPSIATEHEVWDLGNGEAKVREPGELLQEFHVGQAELDLKRQSMGLLAFEAQYQQHPVPSEGGVVKRRWLQFYDLPPDPIEFTLVSWDTASTLSENADWSVGTVWGVSKGQFWLLDVVRGRMETPDLRRTIEETHRRHRADLTIVEDDGIGRAIVQDLRRTSGICTPIAIKPMYEKLARMEARAVMFEVGQVHVPRAAVWLGTYLEELLGFPNTVKDDQVDSTSQALDYLQRRFSETLRARPEGGRRRSKGGHRPKGVPQRRGG
ncbi:phage terminase large subunit [Novosphingobium flavum]|uniref:Phage terminase large subunit n=1 Tax=Novosphingobium flavum TaxID=1778672 RepID=A0A7X1FV00_9SPHN|nr:phage terminase large subunit [Novosphingobium flavum]MBC2667471.1 phage terminase large subunit [Novosphingobium flavum]